MIMNLLIPAAITLHMFLSPLPTVTAFVLDVDGDPLLNGGSYIIIPKGSCGGGLTLTQKAKTSPCPLYITRKATSPSISVQISSPLRILYVPVSTNVKLLFNSIMTTCTEEPLEWRVTPDWSTGQSYVVAGGTSTTPDYIFTIEEATTEGMKYVYKIRYCPSFEGGDEKNCGDVGFFRKEGLLGVTNEKPLYVQFQKANA